MDRKLPVLLALAALPFGQQALASHASGGEIVYECLGNNQYLITMYVYRDCAGITMPTTFTVNFTSPCGNQNLTLTQTSFSEVSQLCLQQLPQSTCNGGNLPGLEAYVYQNTITLQPCDFWTVSWNLCCRNTAIVNLTNPGNVDLYLMTTVNTLDNPCDNSPQFTNQPIPYVCLNQPVTYSYGVFDPDGDSLSYALISAMDNGVPVAYNAPYSATNPIQGITINPNTGLLQFTPNTVGNFVVVMQVTSYNSNGDVIGTVMRDMQFVVIPCTNSAPDPTTGTISNFSGTALNTGPYSVELCESDNFCFDMVFVDPNAGDIMTATSNVLQNLPGATFTFTPGNPMTATVCWTAAPGTSGYFPFIVTVTDDACPIVGFNTYVYDINVLERTSTNPDITICGPQVAQLNAQGGSVFNWSVLSGEPIQLGVNFSCNPCDNPIADPSITTTYIVQSDLSGTCINADTVTVFVVPDFTFQVTQADSVLCLSEQVQLNVIVNPNVPGYTFEWTPSLGLNDPTIANPLATFSQPGIYEYNVEVTSPDGCVKLDSTISIVVVPGFVPEFTVSQLDTSFCEGGSTQFIVELVDQAPVFCGPNFAGCGAGTIIDVELGTGTGQLANTAYPAPFGNWYNSARHQILIRADELITLGFTGGTFTELALNVAAVNGLTAYPDWSIKMGCTTLDSIKIANGFVTGLNEVFFASVYNVQLGWNTFQLSPGFDWDGISNVLIEICFSNYPNGFTQNSPTFYTATSFTSVIYNFTDGSNLCAGPSTGFVNQGESVNRPNFRFRVCSGVNESLISYSWSPTVGLSDPTIPDPTVTPVSSPATYTVTVGDANLGCFGTADVTVFWDPPADVSFVPQPSDVGVAPFSVFFNNTSASNVVTFSWDFGDGQGTSADFQPTYTFVEPGTYEVILYGITDQGCAGFYTATIIVLPDPIVVIPNVFSPNGDGDNDAFEYADLRGFREVEMTIYDRWGKKVHEAPKTATNTLIWRPSRDITEGTYFYIFNGVGADGTEVKKSGHVTLLR